MPKQPARVTFTSTKVVLMGVRIEGEGMLVTAFRRTVLDPLSDWLFSEEIVPVRVLSNQPDAYFALFDEKDAVRVERWFLKNKVQRRE